MPGRLRIDKEDKGKMRPEYIALIEKIKERCDRNINSNIGIEIRYRNYDMVLMRIEDEEGNM